MISAIASCLLALCAGTAAVGYGSALARFLNIRPKLGDRGILGLLGLAFLGCVVHFVVALSTPVQVIALCGGTVIAVPLWRQIRNSAAISFSVAAGLTVFVLLHPQALHNYDEGLYYLQTFKWNREFPITTGLANLHGRLAFNSSIFLIAPLTDRIEMGWITNFLTVIFVLLSLWGRVWQIDVSDRRNSSQYWFIVALMVSSFVLQPGFLSWLGILMADSMAAVLIVYWFALALGFSRSEERQTEFAMLVISAALAATVKISAAPLLVLTAGVGWLHRKEGLACTKRVSAVAAALLGVWMLRGLLLSGCAVYPLPQTCLSSLPWAVSKEQVNAEKLAIESWARRPEEPVSAIVFSDWSWFPQWFRRARKEPLMQLLLAGFVLGALSLVFARAEVRRQLRDDQALIAVGLLVSLALWFWSAPDVRFGSGFILAAALFGLSVAATAWLHRPKVYFYAPQVVLALMMFAGLLGVFFIRSQSYLYVVPEIPAYQVRTPNGLAIWVPRTGEQCWAHELPCAPSQSQARRAQRFASSFPF